ncbi:MAG: replication factor C large subunit [Candidatus Micrarchaeota archaeon]|nr:replication factor C large subunit [Candidatus Micrarchaeota archaeon]
MLWVEKYKPAKSSDMAGQGKVISEIRLWFDKWKPGKGLLLSGQPGVGKTLSVELLCKENDWLLMRMNASDSRSSDEIKNVLGQSTKMKPLFHKTKVILIDEIDGISPVERGATRAIIEIIKRSSYPVVLIANDPWISKLRALRTLCTHIKFPKVSTPSIAKRLKHILDAEGIEYDEDVIKGLARWANGDMRSAVIDLQTAAEGRKKLDEDALLSLGFRERETDMFSILPTIFRCKRISVAKKLIWDADKDADTVFWWIENNISVEFSSPTELQRAYDTLSKADIFRGLVSKQQNWRFKAYMVDLMAAVSVGRREEPHHGWVKYEPPKKILMMAANKGERAEMRELHQKIGEYTHLSNKAVKTQLIPYLKMIVKSKRFAKTNKESGTILSLAAFSKKNDEQIGNLMLSEEEIAMIVA